VSVDVIDPLPCPFGLVRYRVAPDHTKIKPIVETLKRVLERDGVRFLGNVEVGSDLTAHELLERYDAVVYAVGAVADSHLDIPGEELPGNVSATELVAWYSGHPDVARDRFTLDARSVAVVGAGNVALDVVRFLALDAEALRSTDVPEQVLAAVTASRSRRSTCCDVGDRPRPASPPRSCVSSGGRRTRTCWSIRPTSTPTRPAKRSSLPTPAYDAAWRCSGSGLGGPRSGGGAASSCASCGGRCRFSARVLWRDCVWST
jgi:hypothetical protein